MISRYKAMLKIISILVIVMVLLKLCLIFLWPFVICIIAVLILEPAVRVLCKFGISRKLSVVISFIIFVGLMTFTVYYLSSYIFNQLVIFSENVPGIIDFLKVRFKFLENINLNYDVFIKTIEEIIPTYKEKIVNTIVSTANGIVYVIVISITTLFLSIDLHKIVSSIRKYLPAEIYCVFYNSINKIRKIINTEAKLVIFTTLQTVLGLYVMGVNRPLTIGIICGILDILPVVGPSLIFIPWAIFSILTGKYIFALGLFLLYVLLQISREIMEIKFVGNSLKIHPVVTIISLYIGIIVYGVWGVIFGPFIVILTKEIIDKFFERGYRFII